MWNVTRPASRARRLNSSSWATPCATQNAVLGTACRLERPSGGEPLGVVHRPAPARAFATLAVEQHRAGLTDDRVVLPRGHRLVEQERGRLQPVLVGERSAVRCLVATTDRDDVEVLRQRLDV